jgi:hypothetical protein
MRSVRSTLASLCVALVAGCSSAPIQIVPKGFEHPAGMAFVCFDTSTDTVLTLEDCKEAVGTSGSTVSLHAVVTQRIRGELGVVDLRRARLVDSNNLIPGYTFVPVGDLPNAVVIPEARPETTYVANFGSQDLLALPTTSLRANLAAEALEPVRLELGTGPADMVAASDGSALFVALPETGEIARVALEDDGSFGAVTRLALGVAEAVAPAPAEVPTYCASCPLENCEGLVAPLLPASRVPSALGPLARPVKLFLDVAGERLYVADEALPKIHVLDVGAGLAELDALATAVPTTDVVVTPAVPDTSAANADLEDATRRFVYAIDALDGSVLVLDYESGAIVPVPNGPDKPSDRIYFSAGARSLGIATPDFPDGDLCTAGNAVLSEAAGPTTLRGVFLVVGTNDGLARFVDVYDMDADCRSCSTTSSSETAFYVRRHSPRLAARIRQNPALSGAPSFVVNALVFRPNAAGVTEARVAPDLGAVECESDMVPAFPVLLEENAPLICLSRDPSTSTAESWRATFEGRITGTQGGLGRFTTEGGGRAFEGEVDFCERGVLGAENVAALPETEPESAYGGDLLYVTAELTGAAADDDECDRLFGADALPANRFVPVSRSLSSRLELEVSAGRFEDLVRCFPGAVTYQANVGDAFTVSGTVTPPVHRVVTGAGGLCEVDVAQPPRKTFRALYDQPFENGAVRFQINRPIPENPGDQVLARGDLGYFEFLVTNAPVRLAADVGSLPSAISWSAVDKRIYVLDNVGRGFVGISSTDFKVAAPFK